jgi:hypothetical protein
MESAYQIIHQEIPILVYDPEVPLEQRVPKELPNIATACRYLGVSDKRIRRACDPLKKLRLYSPMLKKEVVVRFKKSKK